MRLYKLILIIFIFTFIVFSCYNFVYSAGLQQFSFSYNGVTTDVSLPNESKYNYIIFWTTNASQANSGQFRFYCSSQPLKFKWLYANYDGNLRLTAENNATIYYGTFYNSRYSDTSKRNTFSTSNQAVQWDRGINDYISSNDTIPIYNYNNVLVDSYAGAIPPESYNNYPYFLNSDDDIALGEQDLIIMPGDFPNTKTITFAVQIKEETQGSNGVIETWTNLFSPLNLNSSSQFYFPIDETGVGFYYKIPWSFLRNYLEVGNQYDYILAYDVNNNRVVNDLYVTYGGLTPEDALKNSIANQSNLIREQIAIETNMLEAQQEANETSRGIFGRLGDILSYLNPFSENFFVIKMMQLLGNLLQSLFVPSADFFNNWISDLNTYFGNRFGLLYYPIELVVEFLTRLYNVSSSLGNNFTINTPALQIMNTTIIPATSYNFNSLLENQTFANVYNVYLVCVDVILILGLVILCKNTFADVFGGKFVDDVVDTIQADSTSYKRYERYRQNSSRYNQLHGSSKK